MDFELTEDRTLRVTSPAGAAGRRRDGDLMRCGGGGLGTASLLRRI
jgi:hypothetical protein